MKLALAFTLVIFLQNSLFLNGFKDSSIVRNSLDGGYLLLLHKSQQYKKIPDIDTLKEFVSNLSSIPDVYNEIMSEYRAALPVLSLKRKNSSPDENMRIFISKILSYSYPSFWKDSFSYPNRLNPAIEIWHNKILMIWRPNLYDSNITVSWLANDFSRLNHSATDFGIGASILFKMKVFSFNNLREDPRLLAMTDGSLVIAYTAKESLFEPPKQCFFNVRVSADTGLVEFNDTILLEPQKSKMTQKNWIPFEYNGKLYFIQSIEPLHIVENTGLDPETRRGDIRTVIKISPSTSLKHNQTRPSHLHSSTSISSIWRAEYGLPIRGGTPAILVRGVYLAFFHTVSRFQLPTLLRTYFMGSIAFCPHPPFNVHLISAHPIVNESMYQGKWTDSKNIDYVMFPIGIVLDPVDPDKYVWISFGHQDIEGWVVKFELDGLFDSMETVAPCSKKRHPLYSSSFL